MKEESDKVTVPADILLQGKMLAARGELVSRAVRFAMQAHEGQVRKDGQVYIVHPFEVAETLALNGGDDELICAGLLHDTIEDAGVSAEELAEQFPPGVVSLVTQESERKDRGWEYAKQTMLDHLRTCGSQKLKMLVCADKLSNIRSIDHNIDEMGDQVWTHFKRGKKAQSWLFHEIVDALSSLQGMDMYEELKSLTDQIFHKGNEGKMTATITYKDDLTYVAIDGSVSSVNADELERAVCKEPKETKGIVVDAGKLTYISSAGLRILLAMKKRCKNKEFRIINVSNDVKSIFDVTGFSDIMDIRTAVRSVSIEGCRQIGAGACGEVYRLNEETIIKLYYDHVSQESIELEKSLAKKAFVLGVPTAISYDIVESNGRTGVVYELINSKTIGELIRENPDRLEAYVDQYVAVCKEIHMIDGAGTNLPDFKELNRIDLAKVEDITQEERELLSAFLEAVPDDTHCVHGDLNINNIMVQNGECCLIDMGEFSTGSPLFDISRIVFSMEYAAPAEDAFNDFYHMPQKQVTQIYRMFLNKYFACDSLEEALAKDEKLKWLYPLAWFRCVTGMYKKDRWPIEKYELSGRLLREKLIPFIREMK